MFGRVPVKGLFATLNIQVRVQRASNKQDVLIPMAALHAPSKGPSLTGAAGSQLFILLPKGMTAMTDIIL